MTALNVLQRPEVAQISWLNALSPAASDKVVNDLNAQLRSKRVRLSGIPALRNVLLKRGGYEPSSKDRSLTPAEKCIAETFDAYRKATEYLTDKEVTALLGYAMLIAFGIEKRNRANEMEYTKTFDEAEKTAWLLMFQTRHNLLSTMQGDKVQAFYDELMRTLFEHPTPRTALAANALEAAREVVQV